MSTVKNKCALEYLNCFQTELDFWVTLKYINIKVLLEPLFSLFDKFIYSHGSETESGRTESGSRVPAMGDRLVENSFLPLES